jgi:uncharacterized protein YjbJ (UPF0337 family)
MTGQRTKGAVNKATGVVKEAVGKLAGDKVLQAKGKAQQVQGAVQEGLGDVADATRRARGNRT